MNINTAIENLELILSALNDFDKVVKQNIQSGGVLQILALIQDRIQGAGEDANGQLIGDGQYSQTEYYWTEDDFRLPSNFPGPRSPLRKPKNPNRKGPNKTVRASYEQLRDLNNLNTDFIDLSYTYPDEDSMFNSIRVDCEVRDGEIIITLSPENEETRKKIEGLQAKYNIKILELSEEEIELIRLYLFGEIAKIFSLYGFEIKQ